MKHNRTVSQSTRPQYASLWRRFAAAAFDSGLGLTMSLGIAIALSVPFGREGLYWAMAICTALWWLYAAGMESSDIQATLGGRIFGLRVVDVKGDRASFLRASARQAVRILMLYAVWLTATAISMGAALVVICLVFATFVMAVFTSKSQALFDLASGTAVAKR